MAQKVALAQENERREMMRLTSENENLKRKVEALDNENTTLQSNKQ